MKRKFSIFLSLCALLFSVTAMAQTEVKGTVVAEDDGNPIIGASIIVEGTNTGTVTDTEGNFRMTMPSQTKKIRVTYIGYETTTVTAKDGMRIVLKPRQTELDELIVTGYGNFKKASFTGSAQTLKTQALEDVPVVSIADKLAGGVAGVTVGSASSGPGGISSIRIRGMGSINAGNDPLIVIDGTPVQSGNISELGDAYNDTQTDVLSTLNTNDIESMTVIKDAAAASLYGSRAANGVIVITTKSGSVGKTKVNFRSDWGFSNMAIDYRPMLGGDARRNLLYTGLVNYGLYEEGMSEADAKAYAGKNIDTYAAKPSTGWTDWKDLLFRTGSHQNYQLGISGGNDRTKFYASLAYNKQNGIVSNQGLERFTGSVNLTHKFGRFELQYTGQFARTHQNKVNEGTSYDGALFNYGMAQSPSSTPYDENGELNDGCGMFGVNPLFEKDHSKNIATLTKAFNTLKLTYNIWDQLKLSEKISYDYTSGNEDVLWDRESNNGAPGGVFQRIVNAYSQLNTQTQLTYDKTFGKHNINALLGFETEDYQYVYNYLLGQDYPGNLYEIVNAGTTSAESAKQGYRMTSFLGRVDYNYAGRYYIGASYRTDGSSRLARENRWGSFWSVSGAWRFMDESFMSSIKSVLSDGKLRLSYGVNGTQPSDYYGYMNLYHYGIIYDGASGMGIVGIANPNLKWEQNKTWNIGLDLTFLNRITLTFDYYQRTTSGLIYDLPVSQVGGYYDSLYGYTMPVNVGEMKNKGFEVTIQSVNFDTKDFNWTTSLNIAHNSNKLTKLDGESDEIVDGPMIHRVGEPYYSYYLYEYAGVDAQTGKPLYYLNDGTENARQTTTEISKANKTIVGKHEAAVEGGLTNNLRWKWFDLGFTFTYSLGGDAFDYSTWQHTDGSSDLYNGAVPASYDISQMWTGPGDTNAKLPKFEYGSASSAASSRWLMPTDYLRLKNLTFGFTVPNELIRKIGLSKVRIYFSGSNLLTWKSSSLIVDPEMPVNGCCTFETPAYRTYAFGLDITF